MSRRKQSKPRALKRDGELNEDDDERSAVTMSSVQLVDVDADDDDDHVNQHKKSVRAFNRVLNPILDNSQPDILQRRDFKASNTSLEDEPTTRMETDMDDDDNIDDEIRTVDHVNRMTSFDRLANQIAEVNKRCDRIESRDTSTSSPPSCSNSPVEATTDPLPYSVGVDEFHPYACSLCDKAFGKRTHVNKHQQLVHGDQQRISYIDSDRTLRQSRQCHVVLQSVERRYECGVCDAQFTRSDRLKLHMKAHPKSGASPPGSALSPHRTCSDGAYLTNHHDDTDASSIATDDVISSAANCNHGDSDSDEVDCSMCTDHVTTGHDDVNDSLTTGKTTRRFDESASGCQTWKSEDDDGEADDDAVALECPYCQRKDFPSVGPLAAHIRTSHSRPSNNLFACDYCGLAFSTIAKLDQHRVDQHRAEAGVDGKSDQQIGSSKSVSSVVTTIDERTSKSSSSRSRVPNIVARYSCAYCPVQFYDESTRSSHEQTIHLNGNVQRLRDAVGSDVGFVSAFQLATNSGALADSLSLAMSSTAVFCSQCSQGFPHIYALADHMHHSHGYNNNNNSSSNRTLHINITSSSRSPMTSSKEIQEVGARPVKPTAVRADSVELLRQNSSSSRSVGSASGDVIRLVMSKCGECSAVFDNDDELDVHVTSAHYLSIATEFGCTSCLKVFARPDDLQKHLMDVHAHHLYKCSLCKQVFDSKVNIQVHFAVRHSNECQVYRCTRCSMVFHSEMEWQFHVRVHHLGVARPYRCFFCRDGFSSELELGNHVATHKKPFSCPLCGESFLVEFLLDRHLEMQHPCLDSAAMPLGAKLPLGNGTTALHLMGSSQSFAATSGNGELGVSSMSAESSPKMVDLRQTLSAAVSASSRMTPLKREDYQSVDRETGYVEIGKTSRSMASSVVKNGGSLSATGQLGDIKQNTGVEPKLTQICVYCSAAFKTKNELEKHVKTTHVMPTTSQKCNICDELFPSAAVLAEHKLTHCKVVYGNVCVVCKATIQSEEDFIIHSQQHGSSTVHQVPPQNSSSGTAAAAAAASSHAPTTMPCIVCRQTLVSYVELRLHAKHHLQTTHQQQLAPPVRSPLASHVTAVDFRSRYACCVCLAQFDSADSVVSRAGGYFVCVTCNGRDIGVGAGMVSFDPATPQIVVRPSSTVANAELSLPPPRTYQCIKCQESFSSELEVRVHVTCHVINEGNVHECRLCVTSPVTFDSPARLQSHIIAEHEFGGAADSSPVVRPCTVCGATLVGPVAARAHAIEHGPSSWPHACQRCPLRFYFAAELRNHQLVAGHYREAASAAGSPVPLTSSPGVADDLRCSECSRVFSGYASLCSHRRVHEKPIAVGNELLLVQEMTTSESFSAAREKSAMNGDKDQSVQSPPLQCPECSRQFPSLSSLQGHMRVHNSGTKYMCNQCGKSFSLPQNLAIHVKSHREDSRPHECSTCGKRFAKKENLKSHMRSHGGNDSASTNESSAVNSQIPEYFSVQCLLGAVSPTPKSTRYNRTMGGAKPVEHLCPVCGGRFLQTADLALHLTKIHGIKAEVVEAEMLLTSAALPGNSPSNQDSLDAIIESAPNSNTSSGGGIRRLRPDLDLHASPALSVK